MKFYIAHQLFSQWKNIFLCPEDMVNSYAACDLLKVLEFGILPSLLTLGRLEGNFRLLLLTRKLYFECQRMPFKVSLLNSAY